MSNKGHYDKSVNNHYDNSTDSVVLGYYKYLSRLKENTRNSYATHLTTFLLFIYPELNDLSEKQADGKRRKTSHTTALDDALNEASIKYLTSGRSYIEDIVSFRELLKAQKKAPKSIGVALTAILGWFGRNNFVLNKFDQRDLMKDLTRGITRDRVPTADQCLKLVSFMPINVKALVYVLATSGMRIDEALQLKVDDLSLDSDPAKVEILYDGYDRTTKTGEGRTAYISPKAVTVLRDWLAYRPEFIKKKTINEGKYFDASLVFPFSESNVMIVWSLACEKAGLGEKDKNTGRLLVHPHSLRKYFRTRGGWRRTDIAEFLLGHRTGLGATYNRLDESRKEVEEEYQYAVRFLEFDEGSKAIIELKDKIKEQDNELDALLKNFTVKNAKLENELFEMKVTMASNFDKFIEVFQQEQGAWIQHETKLRAEIAQLRIAVPPEEMKPLDFTLSESDKVAVEELKVLALQRAKR